jgi:Mg-chelatase subunit ChlD
MSTQIVKGSLSAIAKNNGQTLAESFISAKMVVIVDVSGSMDARDARGGKSRYRVACEELEELQAQHPGEIGVIAFSSSVMFCPGGIPIFEGGGTDLARALEFAKLADVPDMQFVVISDGEPNDEKKALAIAGTYKNQIDTIYVGPERDRYGQEFLRRLASVKDGQFHMQTVDNLLPTLERLMLTAI